MKKIDYIKIIDYLLDDTVDINIIIMNVQSQEVKNIKIIECKLIDPTVIGEDISYSDINKYCFVFKYDLIETTIHNNDKGDK